MNRRGFISLLAGAAGMAALPIWRRPHPVIFVPPRTGMSDYLTAPDTWFIQPSPQLQRLLATVEHQADAISGVTRFSNVLRPGAELSEASLEALCQEIRRSFERDPWIQLSVKPTHWRMPNA